MNIIYVLVGVVVGGIIGYLIGKGSKKESVASNGACYNNEAEEKKNENMTKLREYLKSQEGKQINNFEVRDLLNVSDTTACRYCDDLEKEGLIKQVGTDGPKVVYDKI